MQRVTSMINDSIFFSFLLFSFLSSPLSHCADATRCILMFSRGTNQEPPPRDIILESHGFFLESKSFPRDESGPSESNLRKRLFSFLFFFLFLF